VVEEATTSARINKVDSKGRLDSSRILDTSVLVKPSQIHPEREKYVHLLEQLKSQDYTVNKLGVPVPLMTRTKDHHKNNLDRLKSTFKEKHTVMPYYHEELKKTPMEKIEEETKVGFAKEKLNAKELAAYE
jgi:hypothetical protein